MILQEQLQERTESYLKSLIAEISGAQSCEYDSLAPFGELGIDSFYVLKMIRRLEEDFGTLPKSLLFEYFTISELGNYFIQNHEAKLLARLSEQRAGSGTNGHAPKPVKVAVKEERVVAETAKPIRILEKAAYADPVLRDLIASLFQRFKRESSVSRGTRTIAPNLFLGSERLGYFNYGRNKNIVMAYGYTGPKDYFPTLLREMNAYCTANHFALHFMADEEVPAVDGRGFSATPFGVAQRIVDLKNFTLEGGEMRRLRYQVAKFQKAGEASTREYRCGSNHITDGRIAAIIDQWCSARTKVNPLVDEVRAEIIAGTLGVEHRLFLTYLDEVLQNVILITGLCKEDNGYLMDLEFYPPDMPLGGLEFAIVKIIEVLAAEGCHVLSMGATYGCTLGPSDHADAEIDKILEELRAQNIFNDTGNFQFKNKFRPENKPIFLCRPIGAGRPESVIDIIMMIADPLKNQTAEEQVYPLPTAAKPAAREVAAELKSGLPSDHERARILADASFNPMHIPHDQIEFDLKTDSWAQLRMPSIEMEMRHLHAQLQQPGDVDEILRAVFPFAHFVLTASGQAAENIFFRAWPKQGVVLQNLLFPSTIFHQIDKGFVGEELPAAAIFDLHAQHAYKGNLDWETLRGQVTRDPKAIAMACVEVSNNAAGGCPVSLQHLREVKAFLAKHSIALVIDATRVVENAQFLIRQDKEVAGKSVWTVVREMLSLADAVIGSLTKDFCVNKGGIIATNDGALFHRLQEVADETGPGIDLIDRKMIALAIENRKQIETRVSRRMEGVRLLWHALKEHHIPVVEPAGGHCVLIDVKQIPEFQKFKYPVASFLAWMYAGTGIRAAGHSVGMQRQTSINDLVRLAIPVGMQPDDVEQVIARLIGLFAKRENIPEIVLESRTAQRGLGGIDAHYSLVAWHNPATGVPMQSRETPLKPTEGLHGPPIVFPFSSVREDIAIVGMAGRYPKARNLGELWENLKQGRDCVEEIGAGRAALRLEDGPAANYRGGFIDDVDKFDSLFFNISPREAAMLDPQERLFLEVAWEAVEDAGYYPEILGSEDGGRSVGVFVGAVWAMYQMFDGEEDQAGKTIKPNSFLWSIANRVSYWMNLSGPSLTLDTACSSSLTALYLACESIYAGECSAAIVGGVNLDLHRAKLEINQGGGGLSSDGVCRSFGKGANGYVPGEGIGALLLKPIAQAQSDGDNIYGVIKSAVVNHGGRTGGYTIPNPKAQALLIQSALDKANIDARSISYIEAHGTGTELGDPIEINGLSSAFRAHAVENQSCPVGSIKSNIGHLEAAAGVVGLSKVLLQMQHRQLAPSLHSAERSEFIDFENSPFYVVQHLEEWKHREVDGKAVPLRAGISSFGAGGANAHVILESYEHVRPQGTQESSAAKAYVFPLSARSEDQLFATAERLAKALASGNYNLADVAHTLQVGRKSFEHRVAISAVSMEDLQEGLSCFLKGKKAEGVVRGKANNSESISRLLNRREKAEFMQMLSQTRSAYELAELWVDGLFPDWRGLQADALAKRVSLPTYPFADKRHWAARRPATTAAIHPMLDSNESTFERQLFKKTFHAGDFFIYDHHVADIPTLPGVAYLELARKAGEIAAGRKVQKIRNIVWVSPISIQGTTRKEVFVELKPTDTTVRFEVFSYDPSGAKVPHSQGTLVYATPEEENAAPEFIDLDAIRGRCVQAIEGKDAYPRFRAFGLGLGPSFQVLQQVYKSETEILGELQLGEARQGDLQSMLLHPSLVDGSMQAGMGAHLGGELGEMFVPFSIGEVEVLHPLPARCFSYATEMQGGNARLVRSDVFIVDDTGKVLVKIRDSVGVPLREVHKKTAEGDASSLLYYSYEWEAAPLETPRSAVPAACILFSTQDALGDEYRRCLQEAGKPSDQIILVKRGDGFQQLGQQSYQIDPRNKQDYRRLFQSLAERQCVVENICFAWPLDPADAVDARPLNQALAQGVYPFLFVCQALIEQKLENKIQLLYLFKAAQDVAQPVNQAMSGFLKALAVEHARIVCKTVEVDAESFGLGELQVQPPDATAIRYHAGNRTIKKLRYIGESIGFTPSDAVRFREKGVYLITGGAGGLGLIFAEFLAKEYQARLVLTGRSLLSEEKKAKLNELSALGADVLYVPADVSVGSDVRRLVEETKAKFGEIHGVIHAAGVLRDSLVRNKTVEEMDAVFAPKIHGTFHLDEATQNEQLDFMVLFSSVAAVGGNAGQCDYSFANHYMDCFAGEREMLRAQGARSGKTLSLNWPLWADGGMKVDEQTELYFKRTLGIKPLSRASGIKAFVQGLNEPYSQLVVVEGEREKIEVAWQLRKKAPAPAAGEPASDAGLAAWLETQLSEVVMQFLKLEADDVAPEKILLDLGFDSIGLTTFANTINEKYHLDITPVLFFDYPSLREISRHLATERKAELLAFYPGSGGHVPTVAALPPESVPEPAVRTSKGWNSSRDLPAPAAMVSEHFSPEQRFVRQPVAIVGMSGVMPQSADLEEFWENLQASKDMITVIPADRWKWEDYYGDPLREVNKSNSKWGGFMKEIDKFDPLFFGISPREAQMMDPQQRIFLETVWKAIEDSGQKVSDLSGSRTGLFVGVAGDDYAHLMNSLQIPLDGYSASGNSHSVLANRVSFLLNLRGPSAPIDTACSSSLISLHRAVESIHSGNCDAAIVGGVQIMASPAGHISFASAGMLSGDGKCKTFDKGANGYVRGEGCGAVYLKTLAAAEADGNHIYAVIKGTAENHGGRVTTLTAPNSSAQSSLLVEAYRKAHIDPATVGYIECHGTGTSLGDPIEVQALSKAFSELYKDHQKTPAATAHCALSSVKTNIGHLETAAGIAGILKVLLSIKHRLIPANINFVEMNPYISLKGTPFYIAETLTPWEAAMGADGAELPRRAGVSSFGFGGANAHVVLEEYVPAPRRSPAVPREPQVIVLSAKNEDRLQAYVQSVQAYLEREDVDLADLAYTLQVGRDEMPERLALVATSTGDLKQKLAAVCAGPDTNGYYRNRVRSKDATAESQGNELLASKEYSRLAELWVSGARIDWGRLHTAGAVRRISAPTYPFARERHWLPGADGKTMEPKRTATVATEERIPSTDDEAGLLSIVPVWNRARVETVGTALQKDARILILGGEATQLQWARRSLLHAQHVPLQGGMSVEEMEKELAHAAFEQLLWMAPDVLQTDGHGQGMDALIEQQEQGTVLVFRIIKALLRLGYAKKKLQWTFIISQSTRVLQNDLILPAHAGVAGLVGSLAKEYPQWDLRLLDLEHGASVSAHDCLSLPFDKQGNVLAHRQGEWFQQRLSRLTAVPAGQPIYRRHGVYVVIGGAGGVGEVWTRFMIEHYQARVVWIGRRTMNDSIQRKIETLAKLGDAPLYISADATNLEALEQAATIIRDTYPDIHGVVHSAIVLDDLSIVRMDEARFRAGLAAKVNISVNMHRVFGSERLDLMLFFSSTVSFAKSPGQSNYAAGCTFKDSFAHRLQQDGAYPVKVMNWGYWGGVGVAADEWHNDLMRRMGIGSIESEEGMASLQALVESDVPQMALIKTLNSQATAGLRLLGETAPAHASLQERVVAKVNAGRQQGLPAERTGVDYVKGILLEKLSASLRIEAGKIACDVPLAEYGVDSIIGVDLVRIVNETLHIELETISLFDHSTVDALSQYIWSEWRQDIAAQLAPANGKPPSPASSHGGSLTQRDTRERMDSQTEHPMIPNPAAPAGVEPIAIIGMSGRFAGSESLDELWENLEQGKCLVERVSRWDPAECATAQRLEDDDCCHGGFIDSIDRFDPGFFRISPEEAVYMDPQQRLFLEEAWKALESAGYATAGSDETRCGIYVGCGISGYGDLFVGEPPAYALWGNAPSILAARLAYHLNLRGPAIAVDTACSGSLVSTHLACQGLWSGELDMAIAGGVCLYPAPGFYQAANRARILSPQGKCRSFDAAADGYVPGEGVGVVVLKRLADALRDGDFIHGVIAGSGINQDGTSNGLIAPNARAQELLERSVYERFKINPETIQVVEAHGTGTVIGDSIECLAMSRAWRAYTGKEQFCALGTVKTNIGHTGSAAGVAGILKLLLALRHRQIPPSLHFQNPNPAIDFRSNPFYVNAELREWKTEGNAKRRAAVSAFGFSGTNAHLVLEEAPGVQSAVAEAPGYLVVLSAQKPEQLTLQVHNLLEMLKRSAGISMNNLSFTLLVGRTHMACRLACVARDQQELMDSLTLWSETGTASRVYGPAMQESQGRENASFKRFGDYCIRECKNPSDAASYLENLAALAELYSKGYSLDYRGLFPDGSGRIPLPTYPFARERYWIGESPAAPLRVSVLLEEVSRPAAQEPLWRFSPERPATSNGSHTVRMAAVEKMELFLRQEAALLLGTSLDAVSTTTSYFDLGLTSLAMTGLVHKVNQLLNESLLPSALFELKDIRSLAAYLALTYPSQIDSIHVTRTPAGSAEAIEKTSQPEAAYALNGVAAHPTPGENGSGLQVPDDVWWRDMTVQDGYEKVTF